ncbi:hypothetical protein AAFF_G00247790, partial [Aldrovandia affinis]
LLTHTQARLFHCTRSPITPELTVTHAGLWRLIWNRANAAWSLSLHLSLFHSLFLSSTPSLTLSLSPTPSFPLSPTPSFPLSPSLSLSLSLSLALSLFLPHPSRLQPVTR